MKTGWFLSSTSTIPPRYNKTIGVIQTPGQYGVYKVKLDLGIPWGFDNGVFSGKFEETTWLQSLTKFSQYRDTCLFVTLPDVYADCLATIKQFHHYRALVDGYRVALVSQDGISRYKEQIPWGDFDTLFIGGTNYHKLGIEGAWVIHEAKKRNKWVHIGRVNSASRLLRFWMADSWDGTHLGYNPQDARKFHLAVLQVRAMKQNKRFTI